MDELLLSHNWVAVVIWLAAAASDYSLTIWGASLYSQRAKQFVEFEGSYECNSFFEADIDSGRKISGRFFAVLIMVALAIWLLARLRNAWSIGDEIFLFLT